MINFLIELFLNWINKPILVWQGKEWIIFILEASFIWALSQIIFLQLKNIKHKKYVKIEELYKEKEENLNLKGKLNKLEYIFRNYEEKKNPYTLARDIKELIRY